MRKKETSFYNPSGKLKTVLFKDLKIGDRFANLANDEVNVFTKTSNGTHYRYREFNGEVLKPGNHDCPEDNAISGDMGYSFPDNAEVLKVSSRNAFEY